MLARQNGERETSIVAVVCSALATVITLAWLGWKMLAWWFSC